MYKLVFFVPPSHLDTVKEAVFAAGAGRMGDYDQCCWQSLGEGQFRPLSSSNPYLGEQGEVTRVAEYRVEMVCADDIVVDAVIALTKAHPYEEPAYDVLRLTDIAV